MNQRIVPIRRCAAPSSKEVMGVIGRQFGYDAVESSNRRKAPSSITRSEDLELPENKRTKMIATSRDLYRNMSIAAWAIRRHLDYVASFQFQARTGIPALDDRIEELMGWWSEPEQCDVAGRLSLPMLIRMAEARRTIDGDVLLLKLNTGQLQGIESDYIRTPQKMPDGINKDAVTNGVITDKFGKATGYIICRQDANGGYVYDRTLKAQYCLMLAYYDRFNQVRGISPLAPAINSLRDLYEGFDYALAKMKLAQLFGIVFFRNATDDANDLSSGDAPATKTTYDLKLNKGPFALNLDPGDEAKILESATPSGEFQAWALQMVQASLKALDIPFSAYSENYTNYSGQKSAGAQYARSVKQKQKPLRHNLANLTRWKFRTWVEDGVLVLPRPMTLERLLYGRGLWDWIPEGTSWLDELREINADVLGVNAGLRSRQRILKEQGQDFFEVADELAEEAEYLKSKGLNPDATPIQGDTRNDRE